MVLIPSASSSRMPRAVGCAPRYICRVTWWKFFSPGLLSLAAHWRAAAVFVGAALDAGDSLGGVAAPAHQIIRRMDKPTNSRSSDLAFKSSFREVIPLCQRTGALAIHNPHAMRQTPVILPSHIPFGAT